MPSRLGFHDSHCRAVFFAAALALAGVGCGRAAAVTFDAAGPRLTVQQPGLYPETLEYDPGRDAFLLSSFRQGAIYAVDRAGNTSRVVDDPRLCSVLGIALDVKRRRLWAVNSDVGACAKPSSAGPKHLAAVGVFDLATGTPERYVDLAPLSTGDHLLNGIALDAAGNAYVTDSFAPVIYKLDAGGNAAVFLTDARFSGPGINLNGLVVHPDGYLLVIKKSDGTLFKVPLANPAAFSPVMTDAPLAGGDGVLLAGERDLVIISNKVPDMASNSALALHSDDGWVTAKLSARQPLGDVYPTTAVLRNGELFVVYSKLNALIQAPPEQKAELDERAVIRAIGMVKR
jgi:sugar lactone lactonase YvrE